MSRELGHSPVEHESRRMTRGRPFGFAPEQARLLALAGTMLVCAVLRGSGKRVRQAWQLRRAHALRLAAVSVVAPRVAGNGAADRDLLSASPACALIRGMFVSISFLRRFSTALRPTIRVRW